MEDFIFVFENLKALADFIFSFWWLYGPVLLFLLLNALFQAYTKAKFIAAVNWILLEIKAPRDISRSPKAMESVFSGLHGILDKPKRWEKIFKGKTQLWYSLELIGKAGETHFYVRAPGQFRNLVESQFYAQYPNSEITEVSEDHINSLASRPSEGYDVFGSEYVFTKEDAYPIRTYPQFEELNPSNEPGAVRRVDPLAAISEVYSNLNPGEYLGVQILAKPTGDDWVKAGQAVVDKLSGKKPKPSEPGLLSKIFFAIDKLIPGGAPAEEKKEERKEPPTPGQYEVMKAVEASLSKLGFECIIRFIYAAPKETFQRARVSALGGAFKQFNTYNLNGFKWNMRIATLAKQPFKKAKVRRKKIRIFYNFKRRAFINKSMILNVEELATIYHFPDVVVRSPLIPRIEAKKGEPPAGLPRG